MLATHKGLRLNTYKGNILRAVGYRLGLFFNIQCTKFVNFRTKQRLGPLSTYREQCSLQVLGPLSTYRRPKKSRKEEENFGFHESRKELNKQTSIKTQKSPRKPLECARTLIGERCRKIRSHEEITDFPRIEQKERQEGERDLPALQEVGGSFCRSLSSLRILLEAMEMSRERETRGSRYRGKGRDRCKDRDRDRDRGKHREENICISDLSVSPLSFSLYVCMYVYVLCYALFLYTICMYSIWAKAEG